MKQIILFLLVAVAVGSCKRNAAVEPSAGAGWTVFELHPGSFDMRRTKLDRTQENTMADIAVLQFDAAGDFVKYAYKAGPVADNRIALDLAAGTGQTVVFVAHVPDGAPFNGFTGTLDQCRALTRSVADEAALTAGNAVVMYGEYRGVVAAGKTQAAVVMKRAVAKIELTYWVDIPDAADRHVSFVLKTVRLRNVPQVMAYAEPTGIYPSVTEPFGDYPAVQVAVQPTADRPGLQTWYVPENKRGVGTAETASRKTAEALAAGGERATYLELVGDYTKEGQKLELTYRLYLGADPVKDYNLNRNTVYRVEAVIRGANTVDLRISATAGGGELAVEDEAVESETGEVAMGGNRSSNCYLVHPRATDREVRIPVLRANEVFRDAFCDRYGLLAEAGYRQKDSLPEAAAADRLWEAEVLWQDNAARMGEITQGEVRTRHDEIRLRPTGVAGNCVVGLRNRTTGVLAWSWHLWITDYEPVDYAGDLPVGEVHQYGGWMRDNGRFIMDRNLGALTAGPYGSGSWGLLYQWGRKDPFVGAAGSGPAARSWYVPDGSGGFRAATEADWTKAAAGTGVNIYRSVTDPMTFYMSGAARSWTAQSDGLWRDETKTLFDPCPVGWRVPRRAVWEQMTTADAMWEETHGSSHAGVQLWNIVLAGPAWYPAQGYRRATTGAVADGAVRGGHWSSTAVGADEAVAWIVSNPVQLPGAAGQANGYAVRCVRE